MNQNLTALEVESLINRVTVALLHAIRIGMSASSHERVVRYTNDLQVISNLISRSMPLRRAEWENKYV